MFLIYELGFKSDSKGPILRRSIVPSVGSRGNRSKTASKKGTRRSHKPTTSSNSRSRHPHSKSAGIPGPSGMSFDNPYEEELIEEISRPALKVKRSGNESIFPIIDPSDSSISSRMRDKGNRTKHRRSVSAPGVDTSPLHIVYSTT